MIQLERIAVVLWALALILSFVIVFAPRIRFVVYALAPGSFACLLGYVVWLVYGPARDSTTCYDNFVRKCGYEISTANNFQPANTYILLILAAALNGGVMFLAVHMHNRRLRNQKLPATQ
jgi:hypothetical protein